MDVPERLSLEHLRSTGVQPGEQLQPEEPAGAPAAGGGAGAQQAPQAAPSPDPELVASLVSMGFSQEASSRAALAVGNSGVEAAMEWVLAHLEDPDINDPLPDPAAAPAPPAAAQDAAATGALW